MGGGVKGHVSLARQDGDPRIGHHRAQFVSPGTKRIFVLSANDEKDRRTDRGQVGYCQLDGRLCAKFPWQRRRGGQPCRPGRMAPHVLELRLIQAHQVPEDQGDRAV